MKSEQGQIQVLFAIILVILACGLCAGLATWAQSKMPAQTTDDGLSMIEPQGASPQKDFANSQTNLNNAQANSYNAQATAVITTANGDYVESAARATQIVADSNQGPVNTYLQGQQAGQEQGMKTFGLGTVVFICIGVIIFLLWAMSR